MISFHKMENLEYFMNHFMELKEELLDLSLMEIILMLMLILAQQLSLETA
jgi:hypothetical protein